MEFLTGLGVAVYFIFGFFFGKMAGTIEKRPPGIIDVLLWPIGLIAVGMTL